MEIEIGIAKAGRRAWGFDDIAIVPSRRTRDPEDVDLSWEIDAFTFDLPLMASGMDSAVSPNTAVAIGKFGGVGVLNLEGLWTRYEDPMPVYEEIASLPDEKATRRMQDLYQEPIKPELITRRIAEIKAGGVITAGSLTPQRVTEYIDFAKDGGLDILVIQGTVVSAEHVSSRTEPLDLFSFIRDVELPVIVGGVASYAGALHLMRTGAVAVLVGVGPGAACTTRGVLGIGVPQATAIADCAGRPHPADDFRRPWQRTSLPDQRRAGRSTGVRHRRCCLRRQCTSHPCGRRHSLACRSSRPVDIRDRHLP